MDGIYTWTGKDLGWDIYGTTDGHTCTDSGPVDGFDDDTWEWCADHGVELPVTLPELQSVAFGGLWSGSPYLGMMGSLPPGEGGNNPWAGFTYPWHSHTQKELLNNDIFSRRHADFSHHRPVAIGEAQEMKAMNFKNLKKGLGFAALVLVSLLATSTTSFAKQYWLCVGRSGQDHAGRRRRHHVGLLRRHAGFWHQLRRARDRARDHNYFWALLRPEARRGCASTFATSSIRAR